MGLCASCRGEWKMKLKEILSAWGFNLGSPIKKELAGLNDLEKHEMLEAIIPFAKQAEKDRDDFTKMIDTLCDKVAKNEIRDMAELIKFLEKIGKEGI